MRRLLICVFSLVLSAVFFLTSCSSGSFLSNMLGVDTYDYSLEASIRSVEKDSEEWLSIEELLSVLTLDGIDIPEFDGSHDAISLFVDNVLNYMYIKNYEKYVANEELIDKVNETNPEINAIAAIPVLEFEAEIYRIFGGSAKVSHSDTNMFMYCEGAGVYVPKLPPVPSSVEIAITKLEETERTFKVFFDVSATEEKKESYFSIVIKREDGTNYIHTMIKSEKSGAESP